MLPPSDCLSYKKSAKVGSDSRKGCPYGMICNSLRAKHLLLFTIHSSLFTLLCPSGLAPALPCENEFVCFTIPPSCLRQPTSLYTREAENAVVHNPQDTAKGCCERYGANDDVVGRGLAPAVKLLLIYDKFWLI